MTVTDECCRHPSRRGLAARIAFPRFPSFPARLTRGAGTYKVHGDCTGTMTINYGTKASPAGVVLVVNIVISSDATLVMGEMTSETVPFAAAPPTVDGTCGNPCPEAVQISFEGKRVLVYGFR
ncbi:hypothetical protein [Paraburkholderia domus]|uniref:hypothetical protein n=1 Tax=Paraburkholderia domus TaxID=2793075 RepID=UPI001912C860|nr:hypothetical protein [Paraburkholderia domus]MBK5064753.1 hypothetical protein [Burkholderia sp. R-70199]CAE6955865.1 hypothetical protein R70199_06943 [Paraburkholderia domus]